MVQTAIDPEKVRWTHDMNVLRDLKLDPDMRNRQNTELSDENV